MKPLTRIFKNLIEPFRIDGILPNLLLLIPRILMGFGLAFIYAPQRFGTPWTPDAMGLELFEVTDEVVEIVRQGGTPFNLMPEVFAWSIGFMEAYGGLLMILGLNTRITSFFVFITMGLAIVFRSWDGTWDVFPIFVFFCLGLFFMGFGSGKFGLDYLLYKKL